MTERLALTGGQARASQPARGGRLAAWRTARRPLVVAHRGDAHRAPENTIAAFELAARAGADVIELDVQLTSDGVPVVIHDDRVDRTTTGHGAVRGHTWRQLAGLDAGSWFDPRFATERIPRLGAVVRWAADRGIRLLIEPKTSPVLDERAALAIAAELGGDPGQDIVVYGSDHLLITELGRLLPGTALGLIINERTEQTHAQLDAAGADLLSQSTWCLTPQTVARAHAARRLVSAEARYDSDVATLSGWQVDMIVSARLGLTELLAAVSRARRGA